MKLLKIILTGLGIVVALWLAMYLLAWFLIVVIVAVPVIYLWWRWKWHKLKQRVKSRKDIIDIHHQLR